MGLDHAPSFGASYPCDNCQDKAPEIVQRVAGVSASLKLGWEIRGDAGLGPLEKAGRIAQRETVKLIEEALNG